MSRPASALRVADAAPLFGALGDPTRLRLVGRLAKGGPLSIAHLCEGAAVSRQAISKHLDALADAGLARGTRQGREHIWELETKRLEVARRYLADVSAQWDSAIDRLAKFLEENPGP
jgi:DNA-binding transcriptional ArsR family regulator